MDKVHLKQKLDEATRQELIAKSRNADNYKDTSKGKNRYERRLKSSIATSVRDYNRIDMDAFWKGDMLEFGVKVKGETSDYIVTILFEGILDELQREVKSNNNKLDFKCVLRSLIKVFNSEDVYVSCTCPDFCLDENTQIKILNGEVITVKEMCDRYNKGEDFWVYSTDEKGDFKPGHVDRVWASGMTKEMIKVTLDNGKEIITTPNHRYMMRDGSYVEAQNLKVKDSLMPLYFRYNNGYESVKLNSKATTSYCSVYKQVANELLQYEIEEAKIRSGEDVIAIHHKDFNKANNYPSNLKPLGKQEHWKYHYTHVFESGSYDKMIKAGKEYWEKPESRQKQLELCSKIMSDYYSNLSTEEISKMRYDSGVYSDNWKKSISDSNKKVWSNYTDEELNARLDTMKQIRNTKEFKENLSSAVKNWHLNLSEEEMKTINSNISKGVKNSWIQNRDKYMTPKYIEARKKAFNYERTPEIERKRNITKVGRIIDKIIQAGEIPSTETYEKYRTSGYPKFTKYFKDWEEVSNYFNLNHKIIKIEHITYSEPKKVYDISVKDYNNFYVDAGVMLHNCYTQAYWSTKGNYNSGTPQFDNGMAIRNPNDTKGAGCKHILLVLSNVDWMMKIASVINNYIKYCKEYMQRNYADYIFPKIYGMPYNRAVQLSIFDDPDDNGLLPTDQKTISAVIDRGMQGKDDKGRWKAGNLYRFKNKEETENNSDNELNLKYTNDEEKI